jgi:tetratricopeptide (TPR) repeat protein
MSLLLDALKKAAEQKAQKRQSEPSSDRNSDETLLNVPGDDAALFASESGKGMPLGSDDQTELETRLEIEPHEQESSARDATETRDEQTRAELPAADETSIETADATETRYDETRAELPAADDTSLETADATEIRYEQTRAELPTADDTSIEVADIAASREVDLSEPLQIGDDETDLSELHGSDDTDLSQPSSFADQISAAQVQQQPEDISEAEEISEVDARAMADEDLSLMLVEPESSNPGADDRSFTAPQIPQDRDAALAGKGMGLEELSLQDNTESRDPRERSPERSGAGEQTVTKAPTLNSPTATANYADDTRTNHNAPTIARVDSTSTRTYAPDNYDRTLMKPPSDDASKIFVGMKSDSDVVMTPDYAKKVFRSKTSAQRTEHYKLYVGIAVVIVLSVGIFGIFQYQDESELIDDRLRALKRDPMPGVIKAAQPEETDLFAETEVVANARTIEIIETANQMESIPEVEASATQSATQSELVDEMPASQEETALSETGIVASALPAQVQPKQAPANLTPTNLAPTNQGDIDQLASQASSVPSASGSDVIRDSTQKDSAQKEQRSNLQITTSNEYRQADIWLGEAYEAYRAGDNQLALMRYNQVLDVDPANRNALLARAAINMQDGQIESAIRDYKALLLANPTDSLAMSSLLAVTDYAPRETESQLKLMMRDDPQSPYLNFALANAYGAQKRWQEAQRHYFTALQNNPDDPNYAYNLAVSLEHISQPSSAITYYQRALDNFTNGLATFNRDIVNQRLEMLGQL